MKNHAWWIQWLGAAVLALALTMAPAAGGAAGAPAPAGRKPSPKPAKAAKPQAVKYEGMASVNVAAATPANLQALRRAIGDLAKSFPAQYPRGGEFLQRLDALEKSAAAHPADPTLAGQFQKLRAEALLANPLLDFRRLLLIKRKEDHLGLPQNWQGNCALPKSGYDNEIATLDLKDVAAGPKTLFRPVKNVFVGDVDLHWNAGKMLFRCPASTAAGRSGK